MQIGRIKDEKEATKFVNSKLNKVKSILDDIADKTGLVFVCIDERWASMFNDVAYSLKHGVENLLQVVPDRLLLANEARKCAYEANEKEFAEQIKNQHGDLFAGAEKEDSKK